MLVVGVMDDVVESEVTDVSFVLTPRSLLLGDLDIDPA